MMSWLFDDDICWCADSWYCKYTQCFRHMSHRKAQPEPDVFTLAAFMGTPDCPYIDKWEDKGEETDVW